MIRVFCDRCGRAIDKEKYWFKVNITVGNTDTSVLDKDDQDRQYCEKCMADINRSFRINTNGLSML